MLNENIKFEKREGGNYDPFPENIYQVELLDVEAQEKPAYKNPDQLETVLSFKFALLGGKDKSGNSLRGRLIWKNFVPVYLYIGKNGKNALYQITEALIGRELTKQEEGTLSSTEINSLIGMQARVVVKNRTSKDGKIFSNIDSLLSIEQKIVGLSPEEKAKADKPKDEKAPMPEEYPNETSQTSSDDIVVENIPF